jgi:hypothetical protein
MRMLSITQSKSRDPLFPLIKIKTDAVRSLDFVVLGFLQNIQKDMAALGNALIEQSPNEATMTAGKALLDFFNNAIKATAQGFNNPIETIFNGVGQLFGPSESKKN